MLADAQPVLTLTRRDLRRGPGRAGPAAVLMLDDPDTVAALNQMPGHAPADADRSPCADAPGLRHLHLRLDRSAQGRRGLPRRAGQLRRRRGRALPGRPGDRVLQFSSPSFDASVLELCMSLPAGAALVVPPPGPLLASSWPTCWPVSASRTR